MRGKPTTQASFVSLIDVAALIAPDHPIRRIKALVDEVSLGSQEQARGMDHISHAVIQMEQVTQNSAAAAKDGATAGSELSGYAATLKELVEDMREMVGAG